MAVWTLSPEDITVLIGGFHNVTGYAQSSFLNVTKNVQPFSTSRSIDGYTARTYRSDKNFTVELVLQQTSLSNEVLTRLEEIDELTKMGVFPLFIKDRRGSTLFFSTSAWVTEIPNITYSDSMDTRTWIFQCADGYMHVGGNGEESSITEDVANIIASASPLLRDILF